MQQQRVRVAAHPRHLGWVSRAVVSGFLGSLLALLVAVAAYAFAAAVGSTNPNGNFFSVWAYNLANNKVTNLVTTVHIVQAIGLHLVTGIVWATIYAAVVEPNLRGRGWFKGLAFAIVPLLFSQFVFLPIVGAGVAGTTVGAGPLPWIGAIILHAVYGITMGETYALADGEGLLGGVDSPQAKGFTAVERDMAIGLVLGAVIGAVVGLILAALGVGQGGTDAMILTATGGATEGAFAGVVVGIFVGFITS